MSLVDRLKDRSISCKNGGKLEMNGLELTLGFAMKIGL